MIPAIHLHSCIHPSLPPSLPPSLMQSGTAKIEEELKALSAAYAEKGQAAQALKRKKGG